MLWQYVMLKQALSVRLFLEVGMGSVSIPLRSEAARHAVSKLGWFWESFPCGCITSSNCTFPVDH